MGRRWGPRETRRETACPCEACETPGHRSWGAGELERGMTETIAEVVDGSRRQGREEGLELEGIAGNTGAGSRRWEVKGLLSRSQSRELNHGYTAVPGWMAQRRNGAGGVAAGLEAGVVGLVAVRAGTDGEQ